MLTNDCACVRESALKVDSGRKLPCRTRKSNLRQRRASPTLYQLSYIPTPNMVYLTGIVLLFVCLLFGRHSTRWPLDRKLVRTLLREAGLKVHHGSHYFYDRGAVCEALLTGGSRARRFMVSHVHEPYGLHSRPPTTDKSNHIAFILFRVVRFAGVKFGSRFSRKVNNNRVALPA